jgi:hypothetical protein
LNTPNSANVPGSHSGLPKKWPDFGESIDSYRERIYNLHQDRVRQNKNKFGERLILEYGEWKEIFGSEVDANWELNKNKKSPKTILPKEFTPKEPAPKVASTGLTKTQIVLGLVALVAFGVLSIIFPSEDETKVKENKQQEVITMPNAIGMNGRHRAIWICLTEFVKQSTRIRLIYAKPQYVYYQMYLSTVSGIRIL